MVVGLAGQDLVGAEELLEQHDPRELVRQGQRAQREAVVDVVELQPERAADDEAEVAPGLAALLQEAREARES